MNSGKLKVETYLKLGLDNITTVAIYRILKKYGYYRMLLKKKPAILGPFLIDKLLNDDKKVRIDYFSYHKKELTSPPNWFENPWHGYIYEQNDLHWSEIPDFMPELGDIKTVWELSRFDWLPKMAWLYRQGDEKSLARLETWLRDWVEKNPPNSGINWKCGQETSFRALNMLLAAQILGKPFSEPMRGMLSFLDSHMLRVAPTIRYAVAQDNNHGTSEAVALFVVGYYMKKYGDASQKQRGEKWHYKGRYWIENRVKKLILEDGSFAQHSVTYHRLMLDSISYLELFRGHFDLEKFSNVFYRKMSLAVVWLHNMVDTQSGDAPNLGANDGAYIFNFQGSSYRDFRPSLELGAVLFLQKTLGKEYLRHPLLGLFNFKYENLATLGEPESNLMSDGGYCRINRDNGFAILRLPQYIFRPSHADALHLDIWHQGENIIRDAGSYSYNSGDKSIEYYSGTESHSTVVFDNRDQMPRISRFLFSAWLLPKYLKFSKKNNLVSASYIDYLRAEHKRTVTVSKDGWTIVDEISGFLNTATIYWRLADRDWNLEGYSLNSDDIAIKIETEKDSTRLELIKLTESRYYFNENKIPVLKVIANKSGRITTHISFIS